MKRNHYEYLKRFDLLIESKNRESLIEICNPVGIEFAKYFHEFYNSKDFSLVQKMQVLFNQAVNIQIKNNIISDDDLMDYFFHADNIYEKIMKENQKEIDDYEKYCILLLEDRKNFYDITKMFFEEFV